eukprot:243684-Amorphochlora_amoeboformis.AAC.1
MRPHPRCRPRVESEPLPKQSSIRAINPKQKPFNLDFLVFNLSCFGVVLLWCCCGVVVVLGGPYVRVSVTYRVKVRMLKRFDDGRALLWFWTGLGEVLLVRDIFWGSLGRESRGFSGALLLSEGGGGLRGENRERERERKERERETQKRE